MIPFRLELRRDLDQSIRHVRPNPKKALEERKCQSEYGSVYTDPYVNLDE